MVLVTPCAAWTAAQAVSMVEISVDVIPADVTAAARVLYAVVKSVVSWVVGELVYRASNWLSKVESVARSVPDALAVTRLSSNDWSAELLLGDSPSLLSVCMATRIAVSSPIVVPEARSIVWMSFLSVLRALDKVELAELVDSLDVCAAAVLLLSVAAVVLVAEIAVVVDDVLSE